MDKLPEYCQIRLIIVEQDNLCDFFEQIKKKKKSKPCCKNCVHFQEITLEEKKDPKGK